MVCYKHYIQTVSLLNDVACDLLEHNWFENICHILCTCIYLCEYSYDNTRQLKMNNVSHIECTNTSFLESDVFDELSKSFL